MNQADTIYFAGDLFDHKHLIGNAVLATYIERVSNGRYACHVPQNFEVAQNRGLDVRNIDLKGVMESDFGIFNFDGPDLDSGTVVEYIFAKLLDIPAVIIRSDFRRSGDGKANNWNLMVTNYPRAEFVSMHSMLWYKEEYARADSLESLTENLYTRIATPMVEALDRVRQIPPLPKPDHFSFDYIYEWALQFPSNGFAEMCGPEFVQTIFREKAGKRVAITDIHILGNCSDKEVEKICQELVRMHSFGFLIGQLRQVITQYGTRLGSASTFSRFRC